MKRVNIVHNHHLTLVFMASISAELHYQNTLVNFGESIPS
jgi:hypothetical protein